LRLLHLPGTEGLKDFDQDQVSGMTTSVFIAQPDT